MLLSLCLPCSSQYKSAFACIRACECMNTNSLEYRVILCLHYQQVQKTGSRLFQFDFRRRIQPQLRTLHSHFQWKASYAHCSCPLTLQLSKIVSLSYVSEKFSTFSWYQHSARCHSVSDKSKPIMHTQGSPSTSFQFDFPVLIRFTSMLVDSAFLHILRGFTNRLHQKFVPLAIFKKCRRRQQRCIFCHQT